MYEYCSNFRKNSCRKLNTDAIQARLTNTRYTRKNGASRMSLNVVSQSPQQRQIPRWEITALTPLPPQELPKVQDTRKGRLTALTIHFCTIDISFPRRESVDEGCGCGSEGPSLFPPRPTQSKMEQTDPKRGRDASGPAATSAVFLGTPQNQHLLGAVLHVSVVLFCVSPSGIARAMPNAWDDRLPAPTSSS